MRRVGTFIFERPRPLSRQRRADDLYTLNCEEPPFLAADDEFAFRPAGGKPGTFLFFYPTAEPGEHSRHRTGLQHLAFMVKTRSAVERVHQFVQRTGGEVLHEPQSFPQYPPPYFAMFWLDPFGIMLEAVCHHDAQ